jgi:hypothetical protein
VAALCAVGAVIAWHRPANPLGWILLGAGGSDVLSVDSGSYSVLDYRMHHGALPFGPVAVLLQPVEALDGMSGAHHGELAGLLLDQIAFPASA